MTAGHNSSSNNDQKSPTPAKGGGRFRKDFLASLVVFLVALPLCMGIARACGMPVVAGIVTGIVGGLIVGTLAGCPLQVSGPAAGLILVVKEIVGEPDGVHLLAVCLVLAGVIQVIAGLLKLGQWFRAVSPAVIEGMLAGIGIVIIATQLQFMLDGSPPGPAPETLDGVGHTTASFVVPDGQNDLGSAVRVLVMAHEPEHITDPYGPFVDEESEPDAEGHRTDRAKHGVVHNFAALPGQFMAAIAPGPDSNNTPWALAVGGVVIVILFLWRPLVPKRLKLVPAAFVAVIVAALLALVLPSPIKTIPAVTDFTKTMQESVVWPSLDKLGALLLDWKVVKLTLTLAFVASAETLLCAGAVDQMQDGPRTKYDKELWAQGVGNIICGFLHALPMTGVIVRSKANVEAGAKSRLSTILHGLWLLVFISAFPFALQVVPIAALAAVLVFTGFRLLNLHTIKELRKVGWSEVFIFLATMLGVVLFGLLEGVLLGSGLAMAKLLYTFSHLAIRVEKESAHNRTVMYLEGAATFIRLPVLATALEKVPGNTELHVHMERLTYIDHACLELLMSWEKQHEATGGSLVIDWESLHAKFRCPAANGTASANGQAALDGTSEKSPAEK